MRGHANGFKSKVLATRVGKLTVAFPQVRGLPEGSEAFYPKALERGVRSERALIAALAESYIQGVSDLPPIFGPLITRGWPV